MYVCVRFVNQVFGVPLVEVMERTPGQDVPWLLRRFVGFLSKFGLDVSTGRVCTGSRGRMAGRGGGGRLGSHIKIKKGGGWGGGS